MGLCLNWGVCLNTTNSTVDRGYCTPITFGLYTWLEAQEDNTGKLLWLSSFSLTKNRWSCDQRSPASGGLTVCWDVVDRRLGLATPSECGSIGYMQDR